MQDICKHGLMLFMHVETTPRPFPLRIPLQWPLLHPVVPTQGVNSLSAAHATDERGPGWGCGRAGGHSAVDCHACAQRPAKGVRGPPPPL